MTEKSDINSTISQLKAQFTQDRDHDLQIIRTFCESLTDSPEDQATLAAVARFAMTEYPDAAATENAKKLGEAINKFHARIDELQKMAAAKRFEEAAAGFAEIIGEVAPVETEDKRYLSFNHPFESILFQARNKDKRPVIQISNLAAILYYQYATILFELKRFEEAREQLKNCLALNPVDTRAYFELAEVEKAEKNLEEVRRIMSDVHPLIFTRNALAHYYRTQAFLANMDGKFRLAVAMVYVSLDYEENPIARAQLNALAKVKGTDLSRPKLDEVKSLIDGTGIFLGPNQNVYNIALDVGAQTRAKNPNIARMAFMIAYDLTHYKPILRDLAKLGVHPW